MLLISIVRAASWMPFLIILLEMVNQGGSLDLLLAASLFLSLVFGYLVSDWLEDYLIDYFNHDDDDLKYS